MPDRLIVIFSDNLKMPAGELNDETSLDNTARWDSLAAVGLLLDLEDEFGLRFSTQEVSAMRSIGAVRGILRARGVGDV